MHTKLFFMTHFGISGETSLYMCILNSLLSCIVLISKQQ